MDSISPKCFSYRLHFSICEVITFGYFTKLFNIHKRVSGFGQDGGILI